MLGEHGGKWYNESMDGKNIVYKHTQVGYLMIGVLFAISALFGIILPQESYNLFVVLMAVFIIFIIASFTSLTVTIGQKYLRIKFVWGIFRKRFLLEEIDTVKTVKNHWYYGWGIRLWLWPYMVIFNISGFDAVEIKMKDGKIFRIGTDEPRKLEQAIAQIIDK